PVGRAVNPFWGPGTLGRGHPSHDAEPGRGFRYMGPIPGIIASVFDQLHDLFGNFFGASSFLDPFAVFHVPVGFLDQLLPVLSGVDELDGLRMVPIPVRVDKLAALLLGVDLKPGRNINSLPTNVHVAAKLPARRLATDVFFSSLLPTSVVVTF